MLFDSKYSYSNLSIEKRSRLSALIPADDAAPPGCGLPPTATRAPVCQSQSSKLNERTRQQEEVLQYFKGRDFEGVAVTLTFKPSRFPEYLSQRAAEAAVQELIKRLNKFSNGKGRPPLKVIAVREGGVGRSAGTRLHYHLKIEVPPGISAENFAKKVEQYWTRLGWASRDQNRVLPKSDHGWLSYILKTRSKPDYADAIDWLNTQVPPRPVAECTVGG